jgi:hypothetical protein
LPTAPLTPSSYVLGRFLRTKEKYITAKAASSTPPLSGLRLLPLLNSHRLDLIVSVLVATGMSDVKWSAPQAWPPVALGPLPPFLEHN